MNNKTNFLNLFGQNKIISVIILIIAITAVVLTVRQYTGANSDRICYQTIESENACSNGSWGEWSVISQETDSNTGVTATTQERTYTGTRDIQRTLRFSTSVHNYSCSIGGGGATLISKVSACQIVETKVAKSGVQSAGLPDNADINESAPATTTTTTNELTATTTTTVTESVVLRTIEVDFMCSLNKENWRDCEKEIKVAKKTTPIYMKSFVEKANGWTWFIEDNDIAPLSDGQSIGVLQDSNLETVRMDLKYGGGNKFTKEVTLNASGTDRFGLSASGSATKKLNIIVVDINYQEI